MTRIIPKTMASPRLVRTSTAIPYRRCSPVAARSMAAAPCVALLPGDSDLRYELPVRVGILQQVALAGHVDRLHRGCLLQHAVLAVAHLEARKSVVQGKSAE